jgi:hypothetical protein
MTFLKELRRSIFLNALFAFSGAAIFVVGYEGYILASRFGVSEILTTVFHFIIATVAVTYIFDHVARWGGLIQRSFARHSEGLASDAVAVGCIFASSMVLLDDAKVFSATLPVVVILLGFLIASDERSLQEAVSKIVGIFTGSSEKHDR